ncbi:unnamed protein product [Cuscuta campestris]|uniref:Uncharacterized protein n=1 Tax=Cuscuta campestris TaxID=132261 RepID=A0A484NGD2_9ASTE|nr:unnamed protein product [Cuscuta campestris]
MQAACAPRAFPSLAPASKPGAPPPNRRGGRGRILKSAVKCGGTGAESERKLEEEVAGMGILKGDCEDGKGGGVAEALECLEKEAIMGEDEGRKPSDYNRRAQIFDTSSRIFQALKNGAAVPEDDDPPSPDQQELKGITNLEQMFSKHMPII